MLSLLRCRTCWAICWIWSLRHCQRLWPHKPLPPQFQSCLVSRSSAPTAAVLPAADALFTCVGVPTAAIAEPKLPVLATSEGLTIAGKVLRQDRQPVMKVWCSCVQIYPGCMVPNAHHLLHAFAAGLHQHQWRYRRWVHDPAEQEHAWPCARSTGHRGGAR